MIIAHQKTRYPELITTKNSGGRFGDVSLEIGIEPDLDHITCNQCRMAPPQVRFSFRWVPLPAQYFFQEGVA